MAARRTPWTSTTRGRRTLSAELGVDPGPELTAAHRAILTQDPSLDGPPRPAAAAPPAPGTDPPRRMHRRPLALGGALVLLAVPIVVGFALARGGDDGVAPTLPGVVAIDPETNAVVAYVEAGSRPVALAGDERGVWVGDASDGTVTRIDAATLRVTRTTGIGVPAIDLATGAGALWAAAGGFGVVVRLDPESGAVLGQVPLAPPGATVSPTVSAVAVAGDSVWATTLRRRALRVERTSRQVTGEFYAGSFVLPLVLDGEEAVWVGAADDGRVWKIDALTGATMLTVQAGAGSNAMAVGAGAVWVGSWPDRTVVRLDRGTGEVRSVIAVGGEPADLAFGGGLLWVAVPEAPEG